MFASMSLGRNRQHMPYVPRREILSKSSYCNRNGSTTLVCSGQVELGSSELKRHPSAAKNTLRPKLVGKEPQTGSLFT